MKLLCDRTARQHYRDPDTGKAYFSVSQVRAVMFDASRWYTEESRRRGQLLHRRGAFCLGALRNLCPYPSAIPGLEGYCHSQDRFIEEFTPLPLKIEEPSCNPDLGLAGCPDFLAEINGTVWLVDWKSGEETPTDPVQLLAYHSFDSYTGATVLADLYLDATGKMPRIERRKKAKFARDWAVFLSALNLLRWQVEHA